MLKTILLPISFLFLFLRFIKVKIMRWGYGETFVGFSLLKIKFIDFTKLFLAVLQSNYIIVTGTNGKTSTTALFDHILKSNKIDVLANKSGSNLERGVLSMLVLNLARYFFSNPSYVVLEVDEASVKTIISKLPTNVKSLSVIVLNLSRDQLDRYGEVDLLAKKIQESVSRFPSAKIYTKKGEYSQFFKNPTIVNNTDTFVLVDKLKIKDKHLISNLDFVQTVLQDLNVSLDTSLVTPFSLVKGRGHVFTLNGVSYSVNLTKNPASFNTNLHNIKESSKKDILICVNDLIPDGRDVSWFYDIDYKLIKSVFLKNNIFVSGSRGYDFYNFLNLLGINSFNFIDYKNSFYYFEKLNVKEVTILSNYSATQSLIKFFKNRV